MKLLALALVMATRLYFTLSETAPAFPSYDSGWNDTSEAVRMTLAREKGAEDITSGNRIGPFGGQLALDRQYVSTPIKAQSISGTCKMQLLVKEFDAADNVIGIVMAAYVCSANGTVKRTPSLLGIGVYGSTAEFSTSFQNRQGANGDALFSVPASEGDRIVIEIGYRSVTGTTPEAQGKWGFHADDLPEDNTSTSDAAGWFEFSQDILFVNILESYTATGGIEAGGTATYSFAPASVATEFVYTASGGLSTGGAADSEFQIIRTYTASGGMEAGGEATTLFFEELSLRGIDFQRFRRRTVIVHGPEVDESGRFNVLSGPGWLHAVRCHNPTIATVYLKLYDSKRPDLEHDDPVEVLFFPSYIEDENEGKYSVPILPVLRFDTALTYLLSAVGGTGRSEGGSGARGSTGQWAGSKPRLTLVCSKE